MTREPLMYDEDHWITTELDRLRVTTIDTLQDRDEAYRKLFEIRKILNPDDY